jgi:hypothetical protein
MNARACSMFWRSMNAAYSADDREMSQAAKTAMGTVVTRTRMTRRVRKRSRRMVIRVYPETRNSPGLQLCRSDGIS